jgi:hypothetical protein
MTEDETDESKSQESHPSVQRRKPRDADPDAETLTFAKALTHPCRSIWVHPLVVFSFDTTLLAYLKAKIRRIRRMAFAQNLSRLIGASPTVNHTRLHRCTRLPEPNRRPLPVPLAMGHRCARILGSAFDH